MRWSVFDRGHSEMCSSLATGKYIKVPVCSLNMRKKKLYPFLLTKCRGGYNVDFHPEINTNPVSGEIINSSNGRVEAMGIYP